MAIILENDGRVRHEPYGGFEWLKRKVCRVSDIVEPVRIADGLYMWGDEEAKCAPHKVNVNASILYRATHGGDYMAGTVVILCDDGNGNTIDTSVQLEFAILMRLAQLQKAYRAGKLGPAFEATGPRITVRSMTEEEFAQMLKGGVA
jgi:hypothetical protein